MSTIHYIGHGRLESSPENFSILHVVSHELSHVQEFKNEAFRENADVAEIRVKIDYEMRENGKLVAVSGETSAVTRKRKEDEDLPSHLQPYKPNHPHSSNRVGSKENSESKENENQDGLETGEGSEKLDSRKKVDEWNRLSRKDSLEGRLKELESELVAKKEEPGKEDPLDIKKQEIEREKKKIEEEIRLLKLEEETKKNFQFLAKAQKDLLKSAFSIATNNKDGDLLYTQA